MHSQVKEHKSSTAISTNIIVMVCNTGPFSADMEGKDRSENTICTYIHSSSVENERFKKKKKRNVKYYVLLKWLKFEK